MIRKNLAMMLTAILVFYLVSCQNESADDENSSTGDDDTDDDDDFSPGPDVAGFLIINGSSQTWQEFYMLSSDEVLPSSLSYEYLYSFAFTSIQYGWAVSLGGNLIEFTGDAWTPHPVDPGQAVIALSLFPSMDGYVIVKNGSILEWNGIHWIEKAALTPDSDGIYVDISCLAPDDCVISDYNSIDRFDGVNLHPLQNIASKKRVTMQNSDVLFMVYQSGEIQWSVKRLENESWTTEDRAPFGSVLPGETAPEVVRIDDTRVLLTYESGSGDLSGTVILEDGVDVAIPTSWPAFLSSVAFSQSGSGLGYGYDRAAGVLYYLDANKLTAEPIGQFDAPGGAVLAAVDVE